MWWTGKKICERDLKFFFVFAFDDDNDVDELIIETESVSCAIASFESCCDDVDTVETETVSEFRSGKKNFNIFICDICEKNNNTCETDGVCAATLYKESGKIRTSYR